VVPRSEALGFARPKSCSRFSCNRRWNDASSMSRQVQKVQYFTHIWWRGERMQLFIKQVTAICLFLFGITGKLGAVNPAALRNSTCQRAELEPSLDRSGAIPRHALAGGDAARTLRSEQRPEPYSYEAEIRGSIPSASHPINRAATASGRTSDRIRSGFRNMRSRIFTRQRLANR
jgi:hypothetical protein